MSIRRRSHPASAAMVAAPLVLALVLAACTGAQRLGQYDFRGGTLGVITIAPAHPEVLSTSSLDVNVSDPVESLIRIGSEVVRDAELARFRNRLAEASDRVKPTDRMAERALDHSSRYLRTTPVPDVRGADYQLEIRVRRYGIVADSWNANAYFVVDSDVLLLDGRTGRRIWRTEVRARDAVGTRVRGSDDRSVGNVMTALNLARMSTEEIERQLEMLADFAADEVTFALARSLDRVRR